VLLIIGGLCSEPANKNQKKEAQRRVQHVGVQGPFIKSKWSHIPITFSQEDLQLKCKENGPRAIWLIEFWCLMNNTIRELISFLVFVFIVHRMRRELDQGNEDATPQKKT
jgi:hypothetical protein